MSTPTTLSPVPSELMTVDLDTSTVKIGGRRFPAVGLICPEHADDPCPRVERLLAGPSRVPNQAGVSGGDLWVPGENGILIEVSWGDSASRLLSLKLYARKCILHANTPAEVLWLPIRCGIIGKGIVDIEPLGCVASRTATWSWDGADPEWVAEFIDRVTRLSVELLNVPEENDDPEVELISLRETWELALVGP